MQNNGDKQIKVCDCNRTGSIDAAALAGAVGSVAGTGLALSFHSALCRGEIGEADAACRSAGELLIGCTQEAALFSELSDDAERSEPVRFFNIRELAGWSAEGAAATPKMAALIAAAQLPDPEPVAGVTLRSAGNLLIVGEAGAALGWAERLKDQLDVSVLIDGRAGAAAAELPATRVYPLFSGSVTSLGGHLGAFDVRWTQDNPIDLELCVRCNACIRACPEGAIGYDYQVDTERCRSHEACVAACADVGAIDFARSAADAAREDRYDLILDLSAEPLLKRVELPQGYRAPGRDPLDQALAVQDLLALTGDFDKPQYVAYRDTLCAHSRAKQPGCSNCIEACATQAIVSVGDKIKVDPYLCQGCGTCATVCPSGALSYQYPRVADLGLRVKTLLGAYAKAGGAAPVILFHSAAAGRALIDQLARRGKGLPARVIPVETWSADAVGLDLLLGCYALGAAQVAVLGAGSHDLTPLCRQGAHAQTIVTALGYAGEHFRIIDATDTVPVLEAALWDWAPAAAIGTPAEFRLLSEKRTTLTFAIEHLARHAPTPQREIALTAGAPFGSVAVSDACTLCSACVGACPAGALKAAADAPRLSFLEAQCLQCGLCEKSCPENAITLTPRLLLDGARRERVLREAEVFCCTACGKPMGAKPLIDAMLAKLAGHSMFAGADAQARLSMCADCRVVDLMKNEKSAQAWELDE